jgi:hypothetical protein
MKSFISIFFAIFVLSFSLEANSLEDRAFNAYKNRDYIKAFKLYTESAKSNNLKSFLMLGLFYERGIGVKKDKEKAIKLYKYILKRTKDLKQVINDDKKLNILIAALERLYELTKNSEYQVLYKKLQNIEELKDMQQNSLNEDIDDFLTLCPNAKIVAPEDRERIEEFDCALFENFPKKMALFMKLRHLRFKALKSPNRREDIIKRIDAKIKEIIRPMIDYLQQEVVSCYSNAQSINDIYSCNYDYLAKSDPLLFRNYSYKVEEYLSKHNFKNYKLDSFERENLVDILVTKIREGRFGNNWKDMVK